MKASFRRDTVSGLVPVEGLHDGQILFTEWWNGEGIDFEITDVDGVSNKKVISLHQDEIETIAAIARYIGLFDKKEVKDKIAKWESEEEEHTRLISKFKSDVPFDTLF